MSKITRRSYKRKKIVMGLVLFGAVGLVSTGFAAWVLSSNVSKDSESGLKVGTVSDKSMAFGDITIQGLDTTPGSSTLGEWIDINEFSFNPRYSDNTGRVRFSSNEGADDGERLTLRVSGTVSQAQNLDRLTVGPKTIPDAIGQAETAKYVVAPEYLKSEVELVENTHYTISDVAGVSTASFQFDVTFGWGDLFGNINPADYYDTKTIDEISTADINSTLTAMHDLLDGKLFSITITAYVN